MRKNECMRNLCTHTKIFIYAETPNKLFFMIIVRQIYDTLRIQHFWRKARKYFFSLNAFELKIVLEENSVANAFIASYRLLLRPFFLPTNATTYARAFEFRTQKIIAC